MEIPCIQCLPIQRFSLHITWTPPTKNTWFEQSTMQRYIPSWWQRCFPMNPVAPKIATLRSALDWRPPGPPSFTRRSVMRGMNKSGRSSRGGVARALRVDEKARQERAPAATEFRGTRRAAVCPSMVALWWCFLFLRLPFGLLWLSSSTVSFDCLDRTFFF